jgi:hypothetical protein
LAEVVRRLRAKSAVAEGAKLTTGDGDDDRPPVEARISNGRLFSPPSGITMILDFPARIRSGARIARYGAALPSTSTLAVPRWRRSWYAWTIPSTASRRPS